ncbi:three component ABC system middle component [Chitinophaga sp. OAE865]|uniref:three component ABC system middle component n=1 Tax=Chitinophaga sp. OAE865 TaxID=2817898 RepID=UPI001AE0FB79
MNEFYTIQNYAIGAAALLSFTRSYYSTTDRKEGPTIPLTLPVLPLIFNENCIAAITQVKSITKPRFLTILSENRDIPVGLQGRMIDMYPQTLRSLNLGFSTNILQYNKASGEIIPSNKRQAIPDFLFAENQQIIRASRIIGKWFALYPINELCLSLNISF